MAGRNKSQSSIGVSELHKMMLSRLLQLEQGVEQMSQSIGLLKHRFEENKNFFGQLQDRMNNEEYEDGAKHR